MTYDNDLDLGFHSALPFCARLAGKYRWREFTAVITGLGNTPNFGKVGNTGNMKL